jgi:predicted nuclease of restriction endonuclease-like (RecB) superfamily
MRKEKELVNTNKNIDNIFSEIASLIQESRAHVQQTINSELIKLYWNTGRVIKMDVIEGNRAEYGANVVEEISRRLTEQYGKGFSRANMFRMIQFYELMPNQEIVSSLMRQLSWTHIIELLSLKDVVKRDFYITMCINEKWSVRQLRERVNSMLFERSAISKKPDQTILNDLKQLKNNNAMSEGLFLKDPYILDFLELSDTYNEKDLESAILKELEKFILEFGVDFAFMARQKRIVIDNEDYYIDLLFYHRKMKRLVLIELKLGKFKAEYKGQVELYLRWLDKYEKQEGENSPLAIILCAEKKRESIELLEIDKSGIHIAEYLTELPPRELLQKKLNKAIIEAKKRVEND